MAQALASTFDEEELADLRDQFHAIDVDKNGAISLEEMRQVCFFTCFDCKKLILEQITYVRSNTRL